MRAVAKGHPTPGAKLVTGGDSGKQGGQAMQRSASSLSSWALAIRRTLDDAGHDGLALMRRAGMDPAALSDPDARYPLAQTTRLWRLAVTETGDPCIGLRVASRIGQTTFHALSYALMASSTLRESFERLTRYCRMVTDAVDMDFTRDGNCYRLRIRVPEDGEQPAFEALDAFVAAYVRMCRSALGRHYSPLRIELQRPEPAEADCFRRILRAPLCFGAPMTELVFDAASLEQRLETANPELARHNDAVVLHYLARFDREDTVARVRATLVEHLPRGEPSQGFVADRLGLSARSLQRRLATFGVTYKTVVDEARRELALSYLSRNRTSVTEVTYLLGFSDTSSFARAFRRWTGATPTQWRRSRAAPGVTATTRVIATDAQPLGAAGSP